MLPLAGIDRRARVLVPVLAARPRAAGRRLRRDRDGGRHAARAGAGRSRPRRARPPSSRSRATTASVATAPRGAAARASAPGRCSRATARRSTTARSGPAEPAEVAAWLERRAPRRAQLDAGELALVPGVPLALDAAGFDRHTFLCGQSGSGKTYSLGVLLERLLLETTLRIVVLDPNSDHVRIGEVRGDVPARLASRYRRVTSFLDVHRAGAQRRRPAAAALRRARARARSRRCCGWTRSPTSRSTRRSTSCSSAERPPHAGGVPRLGPPGDAAARAARAQPRGSTGSACGRAATRARPLEAAHDTGRRGADRRPRLAAHAHRAVADRGGRARAAVGPARGALARADRDRRGAQRLPGRAAGPPDGARHRARHPDRRRGPQVRALPARLHAAPAEGAPERRHAVRQPRADAAQLDGGHGLRAGGVLVRARRAARARARRSGLGEAWSRGRSARRRRCCASAGGSRSRAAPTCRRTGPAPPRSPARCAGSCPCASCARTRRARRPRCRGRRP